MTEFTYMNCKEYNANTPEERNEDIFIVDQIALVNAQALLNDDDNNDNMNWNEVEPEDFDPYSNFFQTTHDDIDVEIERTSMQSKGQKIVSCTEREKHCDDISDALKHIRRWVISVAESGNNKLQERLLSLITLTLAVFNNKTMEENLLEMEVEKLLSKLLVRTALRMGKVESNKLKKERSHIVTLEKASMMGEKLGKEVLFSHSEIQQNISQLENPSSYESYFNALPKIICSFFQAFIKVLQQQKQNVVNKKRLQRGLLPKSLNTKINEKGIKNILSFYESGKSRFQQILLQDVYKTEPRVTAGRRARDISHYTYTQLESIKKQKSRQ
ncbi:598_t:CDS:2, partial [Funneliformis mosseae]